MLFIEFIVEFADDVAGLILDKIDETGSKIIAITIVVHRPYCRLDLAIKTFSHISDSESSRELLELLNVRMFYRTCCNETVVRLEINQFPIKSYQVD